jgi:hypothetical protein
MILDRFERVPSEQLVDALNSWWLARPDLANRPSIPLSDWIRLSPPERHDAWEIEIAALHSVANVNEVTLRIAVLGHRRFEGAILLLADLWRRCAVGLIRESAGNALLSIGTPEARAVLGEGIEDRDDNRRWLAIDAMFTGPGSAWVNAAWLFDDARRQTEPGIRVAQEALGRLSPSTFSREGWRYRIEAARHLVDNDPRWLDLCVRLRKDPYLGRVARSALRYADPAITRPALDLAAAEANSATRPTLPRLTPGHLLARYEAGQHEEVWRELAKADALDEVWRAEAQLVAAETMRRVRRNAEQLVNALVSRGWPISRSDALPAVEPDVEERLAELERLTGAPVPPALSAFWRIVGGIDLVPWGKDLPPTLPGDLIHLDPLEVDGSRIVRYAVDEWRAEYEGIHREIALPIELAVSADNLHKEGVSGAGPYSIWVPSTDADPIVRDEPHALRFTEYLRRAFRNRGFLLRHEPPVDAKAEAWLTELEVEIEPF